MSRTYKQTAQSWKSSSFAEIVVGIVLCLVPIAIGTAQTPDFPERMPIVERPFSDDPDKFSFAIDEINQRPETRFRHHGWGLNPRRHKRP